DDLCAGGPSSLALVSSPRVGRRPVGNSFDHLVGAGEQCRRNFQAERPRGLAVDDKLEFRRRLYRQIARLVAPENAIDISCCLSEQSFEFDPISGKTALLRMASERIDGWQAIACRQCNDEFNIGRDRSRWQNNQSGARFARERNYSAFDLTGIVNW